MIDNRWLSEASHRCNASHALYNDPQIVQYVITHTVSSLQCPQVLYPIGSWKALVCTMHATIGEDYTSPSLWVMLHISVNYADQTQWIMPPQPSGYGTPSLLVMLPHPLGFVHPLPFHGLCHSHSTDSATVLLGFCVPVVVVVLSHFYVLICCSVYLGFGAKLQLLIPSHLHQFCRPNFGSYATSILTVLPKPQWRHTFAVGCVTSSQRLAVFPLQRLCWLAPPNLIIPSSQVV